MHLAAIEKLIAIVEEGSFSRAAAHLHVSQPSLSQYIRKLEDELGASLIVRGRAPLRLTPAGEVLVREGRKLLSHRDQILSRVKALSQTRDATVRFGISPFYSKYYLPAMLPYFSRNFPDVRLEIGEDISLNLERQVRDGELDFCFVPLDPPDPRLMYERLCMEEILLAVPPRHPVSAYATASAGLPYLDLVHVRDEPFIILKSIQKFVSMCNALLARANITPLTLFETLNWDTVNILVANGLGVGFVPEILRQASLYHKRPEYFRIPDAQSTRAYGVAWRKGERLSPMAQQLVEIFSRNINSLKENARL